MTVRGGGTAGSTAGSAPGQRMAVTRAPAAIVNTEISGWPDDPLNMKRRPCSNLLLGAAQGRVYMVSSRTFMKLGLESRSKTKPLPASWWLSRRASIHPASVTSRLPLRGGDQRNHSCLRGPGGSRLDHAFLEGNKLTVEVKDEGIGVHDLSGPANRSTRQASWSAPGWASRWRSTPDGRASSPHQRRTTAAMVKRSVRGRQKEK